MDADTICGWLANGRDSQRHKLAELQAMVATITALPDADHKRVLRELKKRLNSPKLATEVAALCLALHRDYAPEPPPPPPVTIAPPAREDGGERAGAALFEAAIASAPDNRDNYLVYGDWLEQQGDPLGPLIAIGAELVKNPTHAKMLAAHRDHLAAHPALLGKLAGCMDMLSEVAWAYGFIRGCRVATTFERFDSGLAPGQTQAGVAEVLEWLFAGPGRFLQDLTLGMVDFDGSNVYTPAIRALAARPRPTLRTLFIGDFDRDQSELNWAALDGLHVLWPQVPNLREVTLRGGSMKQLGPISLPSLEHFTTITGGLDAESLEHIARAPWPALRRLSLQVGLGHQGAATNVRAVEPLLTGEHVPRLTSLGILNCGFTEAFVERLVASPLVEQLRELDLSMGTFGDDGVDLLRAHAARFRDCTINLDDNYVTPAGCERMREAFPTAILGTQRSDGGDPDDRHASAYE